MITQAGIRAPAMSKLRSSAVNSAYLRPITAAAGIAIRQATRPSIRATNRYIAVS
ncbi:hypothetical protein D3C83_124890 [compost metagenome]